MWYHKTSAKGPKYGNIVYGKEEGPELNSPGVPFPKKLPFQLRFS